MRQPRFRISKEDVLAAIKGSFNNTSVVAKRLGVDWHTADKFINKWTETRKAYDDELEAINDIAQNKAIELINDKDGPMIKWWLSKKAKNRGFGDEFNNNAQTAENNVLSGPKLEIVIIDDLPHNNALDASLEPPEAVIIDDKAGQNEN